MTVVKVAGEEIRRRCLLDSELMTEADGADTMEKWRVGSIVSAAYLGKILTY